MCYLVIGVLMLLYHHVAWVLMLDVSVINVCSDISVTLCADVSVSPSLPYDWYKRKTKDGRQL